MNPEKYDYLKSAKEIKNHLIKEGFKDDSIKYDEYFSSTWTTSSEALGELMILTQQILSEKKNQMTKPLILKMEELINHIKNCFS